MKHIFLSSFVLATTFLSTSHAVPGGEAPPLPQTRGETNVVASAVASDAQENKQSQVKLTPFTGKIQKNRVRLRFQPNYDEAALKELNKNDLVVVVGETEDFYAVKPPANFRGYVFRTYILDNVVEGDRVNVRIKPNKEALVVAQLRTGDRVDGVEVPGNNRWLEIALPPSVSFYVAKEYVEKAGDAGLKERLDKQKEQVDLLFVRAASAKKEQMEKPFDQIDLAPITSIYQQIISDFSQFPEASLRAKEELTSLQTQYQQKRIVFLEEQSRSSSSVIETNKKLQKDLEEHKNKISNLQQEIEKKRQAAMINQAADESSGVKSTDRLPVNICDWLPVETALFNAWSEQSGKNDPAEFYEEQKQQAFMLKGIIDPYTRQLKNRPGDYMLLNASSKLPVAFLYSTHVNLQDFVGREVTIYVAPRNNNKFAFPAYFVLKVE